MEKSIAPKSTLVVGILIRRKRNVFNDSETLSQSLRVILNDSYVMIHIIKCAQKSAEGQNSRLLELLRYIILYGQLYHIIWSIWYILYHMNMIHIIEIKLVPFKYWIRANSSWWWFDSRLRLFWWWQKPSHKLSTKTIL